MQNENAPGKTRSSHHVMYEEIRQQLEAAGYKTWRVFVNRWAVYIILIIAINQLAHITRREPYRVYQVIYVIYRNFMRGAKFRPNRVTKNQLGSSVEGEEGGVVRECCPHCGKDIGSAKVAGGKEKRED